MKKILILGLMMLIAMPFVLGAPLSIISSEYLEGDNDWILNVRGTRGADYYVFGDKERIEDTLLGSKVVPERSFELNIDMASQSCEYNLRETYDLGNVVRYSIHDYGKHWVWNQDGVVQECVDNGGVSIWGELDGLSKWIARVNYYCLKSVIVGRTGQVEGGKINFETGFTITREGDGREYTNTVTTAASNRGDIPTNIRINDERGQRIAQINWIGGATFGEWCPLISAESIAMHTPQGWRLTSRNDFTVYHSRHEDLLEWQRTFSQGYFSFLFDANRYANEFRQEIDAVNRLADRAVRQADSQTRDNVQIQGSKAVIDLQPGHLIYAPDFQIKLSADWLGIRFSEGIPRINMAEFLDCGEDASHRNELIVDVENVGEQRGSFDLSIECQDGIVPDFTRRVVQLQPGQQERVSFPFSLQIEQDTKISCVVTARDQENHDNEDKRSATTTCQAAVFCQVEGQKECFGQIEKVCRDGRWVNTGSDECRTIPPNGNGNGVPPSPESSNLTWAYIIGGIILAVAVFFLFTDSKKKKGTPTRTRRRKK